MTLTRARSAATAAGLLSTLLIFGGHPASAAPTTPAASEGPMAAAFARAAATYDVPRDLLVALAYSETHLDGHGGAPSASGGYGVMHLVSNPAAHSLEKAAQITGQPARTLRGDDAANILGGAAVLRSYADEIGLDAAARKDAGRWYGAVAKYGNASTPEVARLYADTVYNFLGTASTRPRSRSPRRRSPPTAASTPRPPTSTRRPTRWPPAPTTRPRPGWPPAPATTPPPAARRATPSTGSSST